MIEKMTYEFINGNMSAVDLLEFLQGDNDCILSALHIIEDYLNNTKDKDSGNIGYLPRKENQCEDCGNIDESVKLVNDVIDGNIYLCEKCWVEREGNIADNHECTNKVCINCSDTCEDNKFDTCTMVDCRLRCGSTIDNTCTVIDCRLRR